MNKYIRLKAKLFNIHGILLLKLSNLKVILIIVQKLVFHSENNIVLISDVFKRFHIIFY